MKRCLKSQHFAPIAETGSALAVCILAVHIACDEPDLPFRVLERITSPNATLDAVIVEGCSGAPSRCSERCYIVNRSVTPKKGIDDALQVMHFDGDSDRLKVTWRAPDKLLISANRLIIFEFCNQVFPADDPGVGIKLSIQSYGNIRDGKGP